MSFKGSPPQCGEGHGPASRSTVGCKPGLALDSLKGPPTTQCGEGHGPPTSRSTVRCKPGRDSPWDTFTETSVKGSNATNPQGWEKGSPSETPHFCGSPFWLVFQQSRLQQRIQGIRRRTGSTQYSVSTRTISSRVVSLWVLSRVSQLSRSRLRCSLSLTATSTKFSGRLLAVWSLLGCSEQGVLFPEGSQAMVKELLKACPF